MTREEASKWLKKVRDNTGINELSRALDIAIKALKQGPCEDAISRVEAERAMIKLCDSQLGKWAQNPHIDAILDALENLQPVTLQPKTGHWIKLPYMAIEADGTLLFSYTCSSCKGVAYFRRNKGEVVGGLFCPNCGCRMEGVEDNG